ncbi:MAG: heme-degrading domain-containing protein [Shinella sp.]|nr:heme-degrading domain-containing protein [Shinella sp.]
MAEDINEDIRRLAEQEKLLRFACFDPDAAWELGNIVRRTALSRGAAVAIDISLRDRTLFHSALPGTSTDNVEWIRRKRNTVLRLWNSSYLVGRRLALSGRAQEEAHVLPLADYAVHGGGFPILHQGLGCIGAVTVSGVPQREDHAIVADSIAEFLGADIASLRLD